MPTTPTGLLRRRASLIYRDINVDGRTIRALVVATPECIERCCDGVECAEVIQIIPCRTTTGPPDNPCSQEIAPRWLCADAYCRHTPFETRETFGELARRREAVTLLVGNVCYRTDPPSLKLRTEMTDAERALLIFAREWNCVPGGCTDPICTEDYEPCACLCYSILSTNGQDAYFCCYGRRGRDGIPPAWSTQVDVEMTAHQTVEQIGHANFGACDVGGNPVVDHLAYRYRAHGASDGTLVTTGFDGPECCVGGSVTVSVEKYPLPMPPGCPPFQATPNWFLPFAPPPSDQAEHSYRLSFCPGHGYIVERDETEDQGGDDVCRSSTRRIYRQIRCDCDVWEYELFLQVVNCTLGNRTDGSFGPIARYTETHRMTFRQTWQRPYAPDCAPCGAVIMGVRGSMLSRSAVETHGTPRPLGSNSANPAATVGQRPGLFGVFGCCDGLFGF